MTLKGTKLGTCQVLVWLIAIIITGMIGCATESPEPSATGPTYVAISSGENHTCGIREGGVPDCWGLDEDGQASPPQSETLVAIDSGVNHTCGLRRDGSTTCWGAENLAKAYPPNEKFVSIDTGFLRSCGIEEDGTTVCWGEVYGVPETLEDRYSSISNSAFFNCGLLQNGKAKCSDLISTEDSLAAKETFTAISVGLAHACALREDGTPVCWGSDETGQSTPPPGISLTAISNGLTHVCGLDGEGVVVCWGSDEHGQASPPEVKGFTAISSGGHHTCAIRGDGKVQCWGSNLHGQASPKTGGEAAGVSEPPPGILKWRTPFPVNEHMSSTPTVAEGKVYITLYDNSLHAIDTRTGETEWSYDTGSWVTSSPVVSEGVLYAGSRDGEVYSLNALTGETNWLYPTGKSVFHTLALEGESVFAASGASIYALETRSGRLLWQNTIDDDVAFSPTLQDKTLYTGSASGYLYALSASTGEVIWRHKADEESSSISAEGGRVYDRVVTPPAVSEEALYIGTESGYVQAVSRSSGTLLWEFKAAAAITRTPILHDEIVYAANRFEGPIYALQASTGELVWQKEETPGSLILNARSGLVYASGHIGTAAHLYALDGSNGDLKWQAPAKEGLEEVVTESVLYASYRTRVAENTVQGILALDPKTGREQWSYHAEVGLGQKPTVADGVMYVTPTENYYDSILGYTGWYLYALTGPEAEKQP